MSMGNAGHPGGESSPARSSDNRRGGVGTGPASAPGGKPEVRGCWSWRSGGAEPREVGGRGTQGPARRQRAITSPQDFQRERRSLRAEGPTHAQLLGEERSWGLIRPITPSSAAAPHGSPTILSPPPTCSQKAPTGPPGPGNASPNSSCHSSLWMGGC